MFFFIHSIYFKNFALKIIICCGKHFYALDKYRVENKVDDCAIIRVESLCPFPAVELSEQIRKFPNARKFVWSQEEPRNQGPWFFVNSRVKNLCGVELEYAGRAELPIPAVAIGEIHQKQHDAVIRDTFA